MSKDNGKQLAKDNSSLISAVKHGENSAVNVSSDLGQTQSFSQAQVLDLIEGALRNLMVQITTVDDTVEALTLRVSMLERKPEDLLRL